MKSTKIKSLITLLNDEDSNIAGTAMSELLAYDANSDEMNLIMADLQETEKKGLRKKIHQIQAIQRTRRRRRRLTQRFENKTSSLLQGLADLNIIWYDEFGTAEISKIWRDIIVDAAKFKPRNAKKLASFMLKSGFSVCVENVQDPDLFCLGAVIEDRVGADIILAAITLEIGRACGLFGSIVHTEKDFALLISNSGKKSSGKPYYGEIILPHQNWEVVQPETQLPFEIWTNNKVLKYVTAMLFTNAVCSEGPRYIQILGSCLAGRKENDTLTDILPYPFGKKNKLRGTVEKNNHPKS